MNVGFMGNRESHSKPLLNLRVKILIVFKRYNMFIPQQIISKLVTCCYS